MMAGMGAKRLTSGYDDAASCEFLELNKQSAIILPIDHQLDKFDVHRRIKKLVTSKAQRVLEFEHVGRFRRIAFAYGVSVGPVGEGRVDQLASKLDRGTSRYVNAVIRSCGK